jgi:hypothetical protein
LVGHPKAQLEHRQRPVQAALVFGLPQEDQVLGQDDERGVGKAELGPDDCRDIEREEGGDVARAEREDNS